MTITRADVESILASKCENTSFVITDEEVAELIRTWLAVDDAPSGTTAGYTRSLIKLNIKTYIPAGTYKLVCIETPTGEREGS